jgi:tripartite-type tricarboxylate transporter receptor subunit TctC
MRFDSHRDKTLLTLAFILAFSFCLRGAANVAALAAEQTAFYQGKVVRIVVGAAPGGGFDVYARAIARHWGNIFRVTRNS